MSFLNEIYPIFQATTFPFIQQFTPKSRRIHHFIESDRFGQSFTFMHRICHREATTLLCRSFVRHYVRSLHLRTDQSVQQTASRCTRHRFDYKVFDCRFDITNVARFNHRCAAEQFFCG